MKNFYVGLIALIALQGDQALAQLSSVCPGSGSLCEYPWRSEALAYFAQVSKCSGFAVTDTFKKAINNYVDAEILAGNWGYQDAQFLLLTSSSCVASINLVQPGTFDIQSWGTNCVYSSTTGLSGDGAHCYGDTNTSLNDSRMKLAQNNAHIEAYVAVRGNDLGLKTTNQPIRVDNASSGHINLTSNTTVSAPSVAGLIWADRPGADTFTTTVTSGYYNSSTGSSTNNTSNTSVAPTSDIVTICRSGNTAFCPTNTNEMFVGWGKQNAGGIQFNESVHFQHVQTLLCALGAVGIGC